MTSKVTDYPVEEGANISDHIVNDPREVSVEGIVTNSPVQFLGGRLDKQARGTQNNGRFLGRAINRAQIAFQELERIFSDKELVTITGQYKVYRDMAMISAPVERQVGDGDAIQFTATFRQIRKVGLQTASFRTVFTKKESAQPIKKKGDQTGNKATTAVEKRTTLLRAGVKTGAQAAAALAKAVGL
jgi:hypothetical protein